MCYAYTTKNINIYIRKCRNHLTSQTISFWDLKKWKHLNHEKLYYNPTFKKYYLWSSNHFFHLQLVPEAAVPIIYNGRQVAKWRIFDAVSSPTRKLVYCTRRAIPQTRVRREYSVKANMKRIKQFNLLYSHQREPVHFAFEKNWRTSEYSLQSE